MADFGDRVESLPDVRALRETNKALLCLIDGEEVWIPHSQIDDSSEVFEDGDAGVLVVSSWVAEEKGLV